MPRIERLKDRLEKDENLLLKVLSEFGDVTRYLRYLEAQILRLKKRIKKLEEK